MTDEQSRYLQNNCCSGCQKPHNPGGCFYDAAVIVFVDDKPTCADFEPYRCDKTVDMFGGGE